MSSFAMRRQAGVDDEHEVPPFLGRAHHPVRAGEPVQDPDVLIEYGANSAGNQGETGQLADVGAGEDRARRQWGRALGRMVAGHASSSGRSGSTSSTWLSTI
jgi:hypothetical protein